MIQIQVEGDEDKHQAANLLDCDLAAGNRSPRLVDLILRNRVGTPLVGKVEMSRFVQLKVRTTGRRRNASSTEG